MAYAKYQQTLFLTDENISTCINLPDFNINMQYYAVFYNEDTEHVKTYQKQKTESGYGTFLKYTLSSKG